MSGPGIHVDRVWKKFRRGQMHDSLRDLVPSVVKRLVRGAPPSSELVDREFWAVRDVSFDVAPGEALGIIGPNGAGKSTILKLLTKILRPTRGQIQLRGRVAALIEVAAGFHGDLTGRENVYLQGAIMGMKRVDIQRRFDEIVEFSGIGEFIDTPVKRFSTGMTSRLGFSIAAHLEPDVLIIDEILSVGDLAFQTKAFGRIEQLAKYSNIPVVVVSHQLDLVATICTHAILLEKGVVQKAGTPAECISTYILGEHTGIGHAELNGAPVHIESARLASAQPVASGNTARLEVEASVADPDTFRADEHAMTVRVRDLETGRLVSAVDTATLDVDLPPTGRFDLHIDLDLNVPPGLYAAEIFVNNRARRQPIGHVPAVTIQVGQGLIFRGTVQLNPRVALHRHPVGSRRLSDSVSA